MKSKKVIIGIAIFAVFAGFAGWYIYRDLKLTHNNSSQEGQENLQPNQGANANSSVNAGISTETGQPTVEEAKIKMPDLNKEIVINDKTLLEEEKSRITKKIQEIIAILKEDYDRREEWLNLGILRKNLGDYEGAKEAWEFVVFIRPNDPVAFNNLGDLYSQYLIDFIKAEKYYLTAIEKDPKQPFFYAKLYEFYRYFVKKSDLALGILEKGVDATGDISLKETLEQYRRDIDGK